MQISSKIKIGPFLVISSVLALWTLLITQHVQAHKPDSPTCAGLPTATDFFPEPGTTNDETVAIAPGSTPTLTTKQGTGSAEKGGNERYRYAKITVPQLAAGELRVFDTRDPADSNTLNVASDAVLCHGTSTRASYRTSHPSSHSSAESARTTALTAQQSAIDTIADIDDTTVTITESQARSALNSAATALRNAATALRTAANALGRVGTPEAGGAAVTARGAANSAYNTSSNTDHYDNARFAAGYDVNDDPDSPREGPDPDPNNADTTDEKTALEAARDNLGTAAAALRTAANALHDTEAESRVFQLRAEVRPGDEEYILVTTDDAPTLAVQFHGAIAATTVDRDRTLAVGDQDIIPITITAPGLLTVETTGSTDTIGMLDSTDNATEYAHAESGGNGGNFKFVVPVANADYEVVVEGQTTRTTGAYTVGMDFKVAMWTSTSADTTTVPGVEIAGAPNWGSTAIASDDTMLQIDGSTDADYFLFTIGSDSGFLTVNANNDGVGSTKDSNTSATLYGAMGEGPMGMRTGQIATDADSGPGGHFKFAVPVEASRVYLVEVRGTDGAYKLEFDFTAAEDHDTNPDTDTITPPASLSGALAEPTNPGDDLDKNLYLFNIEESGTLYIHSTGTTDVFGALYRPDGTNIAEDDDSGDGMNFSIAVKVAPGLHILEVTGQNRQTAGSYDLVVNFVTGDGPEPPTEPTTPTDPVDPEPDPEPTDLSGASLDNPPHNSVRSGVGIINGWVCQASSATITITISPDGGGGETPGGSSERELDIAYGTARPDVPLFSDCTNANAGFGMAYNFNNLDEGQYRITARVDGTQIGTSRLFTVVHLVPGQTFPTNLARDDVEVPNFPTTGETTILKWETESQGFVITDVQ